MIKKSLKCYAAFYIISLVWALILPVTRNSIMNSGNMPYSTLYLIGYTIGCSSWMAIPGMIIFWMNYKRGYMKWGSASLITSGYIILVCKAFFPDMPTGFLIIVISIMGIPISIGQFIALILVMKIKVSEPEITKVSAENQTEIIEIEAEPIKVELMEVNDDEAKFLGVSPKLYMEEMEEQGFKKIKPIK